MTPIGGTLARVDPRAKIVWMFATLIAGMTISDPLVLALVLVSIAAIAGLGGILGETARRLKSLISVVVIVGLIFGVTVPGVPLVGTTLLGIPLSLSRDGLLLGLVSALRMGVFAAPMVMIVISTSNTDVIQGLMALRLPLDYALMIVLALNFVPLYTAEMERIADAQKARGHTTMEQGFVGKLRGLGPILLPLTLNAVDRADTVGKVLEMRGLSRRRWRPEFERFGVESWALLALSVALLAEAFIRIL